VKLDGSYPNIAAFRAAFRAQLIAKAGVDAGIT